MIIGIPRGLLYYKYHTFWETFIENLGFEVVVSPETTKKILKKGLSLAESEICLPVKAYYGHVAHLADKTDAILIPRVVAVEKEAYTCPKFLGLPDMIQATFKDTRILFPEINLKKGWKGYQKSLFSFAKSLGVSFTKTVRAICKAESAQRSYLENMTLKKSGFNGHVSCSSVPPVTVGVAGHAYNVFDRYLSVGLVEKLERYGAQVFTSENVPEEIWERHASRLPKHLFWTYERELIGSSLYWLEKGLVDGIIYVLSFACGPDSLVQYVLDDEARRYQVPIMPLVLDEHTGEAGLVTRVEAFWDMLERKAIKA